MSIFQRAPGSVKSTMDECRKFLYQYRCEKGQTYTHTSIANPKVSLRVSNEQLDDFYNYYEKAMVKGTPLFLTERPTNPSKMRADLDFRFAMPETGTAGPLERVYTQEHIERILRKYFEVMLDYIELSSEHLVAYVMEKPSPVEYKGKIKDGLHIVWPHIVISHSLMHLVRKHLLDSSSEIFHGLNLCNTPDDVIDQAIIDKNNWQMYGSSKPESESYRVSMIYQYDKETGEIRQLPAPSALDELKFVRMFSMRDPNAVPSVIREDKKDDIEQYIRHVLPSVDERRKSKLHAQIFGKSANLTKNFVSEDEIDLARKLVCECLRPQRAENYEDWIKLGWALRNIDYRLLDTWIDFSRVSSKYIEGECQEMWNKMRVDTMGMGTLRWWARLDNPIKYQEVLDSNIINLIDICIGSSGAHFDVARVVHAMYKDRYRFTVKDTWYMYHDDKHRWVRTREGLQLRMVLSNDVCIKFMERSVYWTQEANKVSDTQKEIFTDKANKLTKICMQLKTAGYKDSVMKECKALFTDEKFEELLDDHAHLIGFENGVYDLRMHEFRDGLPDDYVSFSTGRHYIKYDANSLEAKEIETYLSQVFTNENVRKYMLDLLACMIDGGIRQEKFYIFTGSGANSKSALLNLIQRAIGDYYCILPIALLTQKRVASNSAQSELERTKGRRLAVMQEPGENEKLNIGLMKELSGQDRILTRGLFKEPIEFKPQFKMVMTCNELPEVPSDDGGTWRRIRVVEYTSKFKEDPDPDNPREFPLDPDLHDKIERWADMFMSMILYHHNNMNVKDIHEPAEVRIATEGYKKNNDIIGQYIAEKLVRDENSSDRVALLKTFVDFRAWTNQVVQKGKKIPDRNQFRAYMEKEFGVYPSDGKGWRGLRFIQTTDKDGADSDVE